jgi:succinate dehydrogenase/fumarate reductase flavoprotein subunit
MMGGGGAAVVAAAAVSAKPVAVDELEQYFEFKDAKTGKAISGIQYKIDGNGSLLLDKAQLLEGRTQTFSLKEYPNELSLTAWLPLGVQK